jgi:hypothetical protein
VAGREEERATVIDVREMKACEMCGAPIPERAYQDPATVRACGPGCASQLARREHSHLFGREWMERAPS